MTTLIICIAIGVLLGFFTGLDDDGWPTAIGWGFCGALWGTVVGCVVAGVIGLFAYTGTHWEQTRRTPLVSVADGSSTHGSFFLGSGSVDGSPSFTWYESDGENSFIRQQTDAYDATIHYVEKGVQPYYTLREQKPNEGFFEPTWGFNVSDPAGLDYDFYIPRGSITHSYRLDNK